MTTTTPSVIRYEVEWISSIPEDECGDAIMDAAVEERMYFGTMEAATAAAWKVLREGAGQLPWEIVIIERQERVLDADMWEHERLRRHKWEMLERWEITDDGGEPSRID